LERKRESCRSGINAILSVGVVSFTAGVSDVRLLDLTSIRTRSQAIALMALYTLIACVLSGAASAVQGVAIGVPVMREVWGALSIALVVAPLLIWPLARAGLALHAREAEMERQAHTDALTGVFNRRGFFAAAATLTGLAGAKPLCAMLIDLDRFKEINDTHGHAAGDEVVVAAARVIRAEAQAQGGIVGRIGGDEFGVLIAGLTDEEAERISERLCAAMRATPVPHGELALRFAASVGVAIAQPQDVTLDDLLARADAALYAVKSQRRDRAEPPAGAIPRRA
jgi:diguanylate cyclase (GGDEF)-like protein